MSWTSLDRLASGATGEQARAELTAFFSRLPAAGWRSEARGVVHGFREIVLGDVRPAMRIVLLAAAMLLLIACVNVGNLLLCDQSIVRASWSCARHSAPHAGESSGTSLPKPPGSPSPLESPVL